ncbi:MAG: T9SS type A sorting domain-containing protein [Bacteroidia bacterium]|nr:T9SS type A sorting domain-containing protein [Bacteroidia bacterium]MCZ2247819.1 T9SS type A sorting domain-containing protein [Bacteroidia bacterium]
MKKLILYISIFLFSIKASAQFGNPTVIDSSFTAQIRNIVAVDIDNDGLKDIVVSYHADSIKWYRNLGSNTFSTPVFLTTTIAKPFYIDIGDVDGDSKMDLLVANKNSNNSQVVLINNNGLTPTVIDSGLAVATYRAYFADFDNDGDQDIVANSDLMITLYLNNGSGVFGSRIVLLDDAEFYNMTVADFNGDNYPDIGLCSSDGSQVFLNDTMGGLSSPNTSNINLCLFVTHTDIDNDGQMDIIFPSSSSNYYDIYRNTGGGTFTLNQSAIFNVANIQNPPFAVANMNADAFTDAVYSSINNNRALYWQANDGTGTFQNQQLINNNELFDVIYLADMDNDSDIDILWYGFNFNLSTKKLGIIENTSITIGINNNLHTNAIKIYPNPSSTFLNIESQDEITMVELYSSMGDKMATFNTAQMDISKFANGINILKITTTKGEIFITKFIKN